jgi:RNA polymerase sigma-70 factor (ECF subfamily)
LSSDKVETALEIVASGHAVSAAGEHPDAAAVRAVLAGDREAFTALYQRYTRMVHGILLARVPRDEVADLVQDVFIAAVQKLRGLRDPALFGPWLARIARNRATDFHRRARESEEVAELPVAPTPRAEALEALAAVRSLPEAYREVLILRLVEGMTGPEIAERTGLTPGSVRVNLHRGMKLLKEKMGGRHVGRA